MDSVPLDKANNYSKEIIEVRHKFIEEKTGVKLQHVNQYSFDPDTTKGNIENFIGVAQIPIGLAGPLQVNGEYAQGEFLIPLATAEGTLVASYNRGMRLINMCGGALTTISGNSMQRAPVFIFKNSRVARDFSHWVKEHYQEIKAACNSTTKIGRLIRIEQYLSNKFVFLRFNYTTGDAAGQNMVSKATFVGVQYILENFKDIDRFYMESNLATDKKASMINILSTRGKRVTAEVTIPGNLLQEKMRTSVESLHYHFGIASVGGFVSGVNNNGLHAANGLTAMFIATGQDVANIAESSTGIIYCEENPKDHLYISITLPSLIVASYGGGTGLATQRECQDILGCYGQDGVMKLAEIMAAAVLAGEISLAAAISSLDWIWSHERMGRNR
ncbi:MAG: hydroxymethylglutaryl-CoA reductase [Deltaproteobacteria bacterium]|nr:hydroxymethylglutaryl-CoA reductase [Deltaproteobacteria bacterium]